VEIKDNLNQKLMKLKNILSWFALLFGEALIISAFILFRGDLTDNILILNIIVTTIIYCLFFIDILIPWVNFSDKSQRKVGSLGVRWFFTWLYVILAISAMVICNTTFDLIFSTQLIIHGALFFLLLLGLIAAIQTSDKIKEVFIQENANRNGIVEMREAIKQLKDKMIDASELPEYFICRINTFEDNIRFISPTNNEVAYELEHLFSNTINDISYAISNYSMNEKAIESNLKKCERIYQKRKQTQSN
jgi:hypothetical protein